MLFRALLQCLLEEITSTLELLASVAFNEFGQINVPDFESYRIGKEFHASFVHLLHISIR